MRSPLGIAGSRFASAMPALGLVLALAPAGVALGQPPLGSPAFQVNEFTPDAQRRPRISSDAESDFVVVWSSDLQDGDGAGVFGRRFTSTGAAAGSEFQVNVTTVGSQNQPAVAMDADGDFVVVWRTGATDGSTGEIVARWFDAAGAPQSGELAVNTYTPDVQHVPAVAIDDGGDFVVVWTSETQDGSTDTPPSDGLLLNGGIFGRRFDAGGVAQGGEFQVNTYTPKAQHDPVIAMRADGVFVVAWASRLQDEGGDSNGHDGVFAQRFDAAATPLGVELQVNTYTPSYQHHQAIGIDDEGDFVVVWHSGHDGSYSGVFAQRFDSAGGFLGGEFQVNVYTPQYQEDIAVAMEGDGDFVVAWDSRYQDGTPGWGIFGRSFDSAGTALSGDFQINAFTPGYQRFPVATRSIDGQFVVAWQGGGTQDGSDYGIFAKRFGGVLTGPVLDADGNGALSALTDGLLVLRWAFGFTGATLVNGAIAVNCVRCSGPDVDTYLDSVASQLDIDDNGAVSALTDGLLVLRYLFGFTGATLINGAVAGDCMRCTAPEIEAYLGTID